MRKNISIEQVTNSLNKPEIIAQLISGFYSTVNHSFIEDNKTLILSCVDSRVHPAMLVNKNPWILRTVANISPAVNFEAPLDNQSIEIAAGIKYFIINGGKEIVVMGHTKCGGAEARVLQNKNLQKVNTWVNNVKFDDFKDSYPQLIQDLSKDKFIYDAILEKSEKSCLESSIKSIKAMPFVQNAVYHSKLSIAGVICDIKNGNVKIEALNSSACEHVQKVLTAAKKYKHKYWRETNVMQALYEHGQHPKALILIDVSTNVTPSTFMNVDHGDAFVSRILGGHFNHKDLTSSFDATTQFAVKAKKVPNIIIIGHSGDINEQYMKGALDNEPLITAHLERTAPRIKKLKMDGVDPKIAHKTCMIDTFESVHAHADVVDAFAEKRIDITMFYIDHDRSVMQWFDKESNEFVDIETSKTN